MKARHGFTLAALLAALFAAYLTPAFSVTVANLVALCF